MKVKIIMLLAVAGSVALAGRGAWAQEPGVVSHIKVLSDKVEDISSLEAWKKSFIHDGMTDQEKALAVWTTVVKFRQQTNPPMEYLESDGGHIHDPIKDFNVYGYGQCCCASAGIEALSRYVGLESRGWGITGHSVPEVKIAGHWGMLDASLVNYFQKPDGTICGVQEISESVAKWLGEKPELLKVDNHKDYYALQGKGQWKADGPEVLKYSTGYDGNGWLPAHTHAWGDTLLEFRNTKANFVFEYGTALGYEVNIQLRPGEKLIRNWGNKGLDVNALEKKAPSPMIADTPLKSRGDMEFAIKYGDMTEGRVGNGMLEYDVPLASEKFKGGMLTVDNLAMKGEDGGNGAAVHVKDAGKSGVLIFRMPSSYVYLAGELTFKPVVANGGSVAVSFSENNGLDWKPLATVTTSDAQKIDLKDLVYRRYDYQLKFEMKGAGTGVDAIKVSHDIQHSQRVLPILGAGDNKISFSEGAQEGTITIEGNLLYNGGNAPKGGKNNKLAEGVGKNIIFNEFHPVLENVDPTNFKVKAGKGSVTIPVATPGDMTRIRIGAFYRTSAAGEKWVVETSFDAGKTWLPVETLDGPNKGNSKYVVFDKVPAGSRAALVRFSGESQTNDDVMMHDLRIDADYKEPAGGVAPVKVTYAYEEDGKPKTDVHVAKGADEGYVIHCESKPKMTSITLELAE